MSLQVILDSIRAAGEAQLREMDLRKSAEIREILADADLQAHEIQEEARETAALPAGRERARIIHRARLDGLHNLGNVREALIDTTLDQTRGRLANLRADSTYPQVLRQFTEEALAEVSGSLEEAAKARLDADPRDQDLVVKILSDLGLTLPVNYNLECWGGLIAQSEDGRVVVINTLEARLERAIPYLRRYLAALYEEEHFEPETDQAEFAPL
jgi:V/A-type H+-transporting ATPase subunit E